jgi:hypothetical protein
VELELPHERDGARGGIDDLTRVALSFDRDVVVRREQAAVAGDRRQQVVQVVRDRAERGPVVRLSDCEEMSHLECFGRRRPRL